MSVLKEGVVGGALNLYFIYKFLRILTTPWESTDAFKFGIVDKKGKILKKHRKLKTDEEKDSYTMMHRLVWKLKRLMEKIPFGKSRLASYAAALWLIKEEKNFNGTDEELQESFLSFLETDWKNEALILKENYEGDMDKKTYSKLKEGIDIKKASMKDVIKDFQSSDAPQFKGKSDKKKKEMAIAAKLSKEGIELDEVSKLPPHLAKFFDKKGNLKPEVAARVAKGREKLNWKDVTPKGYGPKEEVEIDEKWEVGVVYHQDFGGGEISYFRADSLLKNKRWKGMGVDEYSGKQKKPRNITADEKTPGWEITPKNEIPKGLKEEVLEDGTNMIIQRYREVTPGEMDEKHGGFHWKKGMKLKGKKVKKMKDLRLYANPAGKKKSAAVGSGRGFSKYSDTSGGFSFLKSKGRSSGSGYVGAYNSTQFSGETEISEAAVLSITDVDKWTTEIYKGIDAGWKSVGKSTLGGDKNVAIMIKVTVEPEKDWPNNILHNAKFGMIRIATDGTMEMFASGYKIKNMRKTKIKSAKDVVKKINTWIKSIEEAYGGTKKWKKGQNKMKKAGITLQRKDKASGYVEDVEEASLGSMISKKAKKLGKASSGYTLYHKDFSSAMQHAYDHAKKKGHAIDPKEIDDKVATGPKKPSSGKTNRYELKAGRKKVMIQVANLDNKRYELNMYIEGAELGEGWKKGNYKVTDVKTGKVLGTFKSGSKAQKYVDDIFQKGDYEALTVELDEVKSDHEDEIAAFKAKGGKVKKLPPGRKFKSLWKKTGEKLKKAPRKEDLKLNNFSTYIKEGRPALDPDYVPSVTRTDKLKAKLLSTQKKLYSARDILSMANKYKLKLDGDPVGGKSWGGDWQIALKKGINLEYQYGPNSTYIKGWKFDKNAIKNYIEKYANDHETPRDYAPMGGKVLVGGLEAAFEVITEHCGHCEMGIDEEAPANSVAGGNVNLDPFVKKKRKNAKVQTEMFGGQKVFVVSPDRYFQSRLGKSRYARYEKYVGNDKLGEAIRQYGRNNPKNSIILKNSGNGAMLYLKYGRK
jgi:hypothetical protein